MSLRSDILIIGGGPVGLYFAGLCEKEGLDYLVLEASNELGGQIVKLYPQKIIEDLPEYEQIVAKDYVADLLNNVDAKKCHLNEEVVGLKGNKIITSKGEYEFKYLIIASGLGFSKPRPLGIEHENECKNILYSLDDFSFLKGKKVAIFGGGDSALDWAKAISQISDDVHLIHRRLEFRGNPETIKGCKNLNVHLPYVPNSGKIEENLVKEILIKEVVGEGSAAKIVAIPVDYVLVNYGNIPAPSPFEFEKDGAFLKVNEFYQTKDNIFAIGDVASYENKKRRLAPGNHEADVVFSYIKSK